MNQANNQFDNVMFYTNDGDEIVLNVLKTTEGKTLFESQDPAPLLKFFDIDFAADHRMSLLRGVSIPGEGTFFNVFDNFGKMSSREMSLDKKQTENLLSKIC